MRTKMVPCLLKVRMCSVSSKLCVSRLPLICEDGLKFPICCELTLMSGCWNAEFTSLHNFLNMVRLTIS